MPASKFTSWRCSPLLGSYFCFDLISDISLVKSGFRGDLCVFLLILIIVRSNFALPRHSVCDKAEEKRQHEKSTNLVIKGLAQTDCKPDADILQKLATDLSVEIKQEEISVKRTANKESL